MTKIFGFSILLILLLANAVWAATTADSATDESAQSAGYVSISIDRVVVDTAELATASATLAGSVDQLALAIGQLSADSEELSDEQKKIMLDAVASAQQASVALTELAQQLPQTAQVMSDRLPQMISELSSIMQAARDSTAMITNSLPLATENATKLVDSVLDSALQKLIVYTIALLAIIALALIAIMWFIYRQYLGPLMQKLDELVGAPEHFEHMALHMKGTSENLLALQDDCPRIRLRSMEKFRRR